MSAEEILQKISGIAERSSVDSEVVDQEALWPEASMRALQSAGLGGLTVPKQFGGLGGGLLLLSQATEILGKECGSAAMCFGMHCVGSAVISAKATKAQIKSLLTPIIRGQHITTLSLSEPGTGSHFYIPETTMLSLDEGMLQINGTKSFVTNGEHADSYVVSTVAAEANSPLGQFSMVVVPREAAGLHWKEAWRGFGMRGNASNSVELKDVKVSEQNLLGERGDQSWYVFEVVAPYFLMAMAGTYLGLASAALHEGISHLKARKFNHNGNGLFSVSIVQHRLGTLWSRLESARQLVYHAARLGDLQDPNALPAILSAKAEVGDTATLVVNDVMTLMGGRGYGENGKLGRLLRDVRACHVMAPTTDMLRTWTGRALLDSPLLGEE